MNKLTILIILIFAISLFLLTKGISTIVTLNNYQFVVGEDESLSYVFDSNEFTYKLDDNKMIMIPKKGSGEVVINYKDFIAEGTTFESNYPDWIIEDNNSNFKIIIPPVNCKYINLQSSKEVIESGENVIFICQTTLD